MTGHHNNRIDDRIRGRAMRLLGEGYSVKQVAERLGVSERTVWTWKGARGHEKPVPKLAEGLRLLHQWPNARSE